MKEFVGLVIDWVGRYVGGFCEWIENYGGWVGNWFKCDLFCIVLCYIFSLILCFLFEFEVKINYIKYCLDIFKILLIDIGGL